MLNLVKWCARVLRGGHSNVLTEDSGEVVDTNCGFSGNDGFCPEKRFIYSIGILNISSLLIQR